MGDETTEDAPSVPQKPENDPAAFGYRPSPEQPVEAPAEAPAEPEA